MQPLASEALLKVSLTQEAQEILRRKVASGDYASAADVETVRRRMEPE